MRKILTILLLSITLFSVKSYAYENKACEAIKKVEWIFKYCLKNFYAIDDANIWEYKIYNNKKQVIFHINYFNKWLSWKFNISIYENKYWNHFLINMIPYTLDDDEFCWLNCDFDKYEYIKSHDKILQEYNKDLWVYIDWKKVFDYAISKEKYVYNSFSDFINASWIYACDDKENCIWKKYDTWIYLSEKIRKRLDRFIKKIDEKKYDKEKILKKLEVLYKKFKNWKSYKSRFYTEVIIYLYSEITINKLKQQEELEKISFYR